MSRESGFSLLELMMAMAIMMTVIGSVFSLLNPAQGAFAMEPEAADLQQRLRVAADTLYKDLIMAGAGPYLGEPNGSLLYFFPPVQPSGQDRITLIYVPATLAQTTLTQAVTSGATMLLKVDSEAGFKAGMTVIIFDDTGNYDTFTITDVNDTAANITVNRPASSNDTVRAVYPIGSKVLQAVVRTYHLKPDTNQLMQSDGSIASDLPVVDNVVDLSFEYWGDPDPPKRTTNAMNSAGPWMTYGPAPAVTENCLIAVDQGRQIERLPTLPTESNARALVKLTEDQLTDGSFGWCPTDTTPNRYSPNLFRIRKIVATVRVQAALAAMRGPAGALFRIGGTSTSATRWVPDQQARFEVSPRNMNLGR
jgi:hypothetical protein